MERTSHVIKGERTIYKPFTKCTFNGFSRNFPPELRNVLHPNEYDSIIKNINLNSVGTKKTSTLKVFSVSGDILCMVIIGIPISFGCYLADKIIYQRFYRKITKKIQSVLFQINASEPYLSRGIEFSLRKSPTSRVGVDYSIVVSYLRSSGGRAQATLMNISAAPSGTNNISSTTNIDNNSCQLPPTSTTISKPSTGKQIDLKNIPIDK
ncbi:hypothetical protein ACTFIZ_006190 [Dictyostelium cf. discoideum]